MWRSSMRPETVAGRGLLVALAVAVAGGAAPAATGDAEPPEAQARAVAALPGEVRDLVARPPLTVAGMGSAIGGETRSVQGLLRDLDARVVGQEIRISLAADVLFDFDRAEVKPAAAASLGKVAAVIRSQPGATVRVDGHTDSVGDDAYNQKLSERRAGAVAHWLRQQEALGDIRLETHGFGETRPVAPNTRPDGKDDPAGRQKNRRVEIVVHTSG